MATRVDSGEGWRVRMVDGEYELTLSELAQWIIDGRIAPSQDVRPPTTKRWEHAGNCIELTEPFAERDRRVLAARSEAEAPARAAAAQQTVRAKKILSGIGISMGVLGAIILFTGTDLGIVFGIALGAFGSIIFVIGHALQ